MSTSVELPALGESVTEGTVSRWLKQVGDTVEADEALVEVSTDKVDTEIPSPVAGTILEIKVEEDETVEVGTVLVVIGDAEEGSSDDSSSDDADSADEAEEAPAEDEDSVDEEPAKEESAKKESADSGKAAPSGGSASGTEVTLPALGESVTEGTVSRWLKEVGDEVEADEALVEVSTDKVDTEIPSPEAGTLLEIRVQEDETVEVGTVLAIIGDASQASSSEGDEDSSDGDEDVQEPAAAEEPDAKKAELKKEEQKTETKKEEPKKEEPAKDTKADNAKEAPKAAPRASGDEGTYVTPLVRKLAGQHNVDLSSLEGTGVGGRIRKQDVLDAADKTKRDTEKAEQDKAQVQKDAEKAEKDAAAEVKAEKPASKSAPSKASPSADAQAKRGTTEKMSRLRATIAKRMVESLQVSAQLTATVEVDLTAISRLRAQAKVEFAKREGAKLSYLPFIAAAAVEALKQFPKVNATIDTDAGTITYAGSENLGIAVDTEKGLMVPVIKEAGDLNLAGMARKISDLAERTRTNKVTPDDLTGGTFTITNYGSAGTLMDSPIINQPQVAILGTGALVKRPMVVSDERLGDTIAIRDMMYLSMSYDHRLVDGADAARFLSVVKARLEAGDFAAELGL